MMCRRCCSSPYAGVRDSLEFGQALEAKPADCKAVSYRWSPAAGARMPLLLHACNKDAGRPQGACGSCQIVPTARTRYITILNPSGARSSMGMPMKVQRYLRGCGAIVAVGVLAGCSSATMSSTTTRVQARAAFRPTRKRRACSERKGLFLSDIFGDDEASSSTGGGNRRQQLPVAGVPRHAGVHAAAVGGPVRRRHHHRVVRRAGPPVGTVQGYCLHPRPGAAFRRGSGPGWFRQHQSESGAWIDEPANSELDRQLEDTILTRARELRVGSRSR